MPSILQPSLTAHTIRLLTGAAKTTMALLLIGPLVGCMVAPVTKARAPSKPATQTAAVTPKPAGQGNAVQTTATTSPKPATETTPATNNTASTASIAATPAEEKPRPFFETPILQTLRHDNLVERIRAGFAMPALDTHLVAQHERWIAKNPEYLNRVFDRGGKYLYHIVEELEARKMPTELALLPIVESAFNPQAFSKAKAAGLWQFIPSTGRIYELDQNWWIDERRDVIDSTRAALDYLQKLYEMQDNDWFLALASYNYGENGVLRQRKRNEASGRPTDYEHLKLPKETQHYVPKLIALRNVLARPEDFGISLPVIPNKPFFVVIDKEQSIDLALAAKFAGMTMDEFTSLNPSHHRPVISASRTNRIILPADRAASFQKQMQEHIARGEPLVTWKPYTLRAQETLAALAKRIGVSTQELIRANGLKRNSSPLPGTTILAPVAAQDDEPHIETTLARFAGTRVIEKEKVTAVYHKVGKKDSLAKIAKRYKVSTDEIMRLNKLSGEVQPGQRLLIRTAKTQTVMTNEQGVRTVIAANDEASDSAKPAAKSAKKPKPKSSETSSKKKSGEAR